MKSNWRLIAAGLLVLGMPAWFVFWVHYPSVLIYVYAVMGYVVLAAYLAASGAVQWIRS